jgi:glycosyltransferase involved in cell wall biosynthesis
VTDASHSSHGSPTPRRLAFAITSLEPSGAEQIVLDLTRHFRQQPEWREVHVWCLSAKRGRIGDQLTSEGTPVHYLDVANKWDPRFLLRWSRGMADAGIDLLNTHLFHANIPGRIAAWMAGVRHVVSTVHIVERRFRPWHFWLDRATASGMDEEICVSRAVQAFMRKRTGLPESRLPVVYDGVDTAAIRAGLTREPDADDSRALLARLREIQTTRTVVGSIGRLSAQKGYDTLIRAIARTPDAHLVLVGDGEDRAALSALAVELGAAERVTFAGYQHPQGPWLSTFDLFAMPSRWEGFGLTAVEAMAAGLPLVATSVDSLPEIVTDGDTGLLIPPDDVDALASAITRLAGDADLRARLGRAASAAADRYSTRAMCDGYAEVFRRVLSAG